MKNNIIITSFIFIFCSATIHKYYHSYCSVEINPKTKNAELVIDIFCHDLEISLTKNNGKEVKIENRNIDTLLKSYLLQTFILKNKNGNILKFKYVGSEVKQEQISVFLEYENLKSFNGLTLTNSLLVREFPTQINKVNLKNAEWKHTMVYTNKLITQKIPQ